MNTKFSVIIPIYNVEKYLKICIDSVLNQIYENFELILVDDGSTDDSSNICDQYKLKDNRIAVIHKTNGGLVSARKAGAIIASGDYICCIDGDDYVENDYLLSFNNVITRFTPDVLCCSYYIDTDGKKEKNILPYRKGMYSRNDIINEIFPCLIQAEDATYFRPSVWAKAFKKEKYLPIQMQIDEHLKIGEDGACTIPIVYNSNSIYIMDNCSYFYRRFENSMTSSRKVFSWDGPELIYSNIIRFIDPEAYNFKEQLYRKNVHELFTVVISRFNKHGSMLSIIKDIRKNIECSFYKESLKYCSFEGSVKAKIMLFALKYHLILTMFIYSKIKNRL